MTEDDDQDTWDAYAERFDSHAVRRSQRKQKPGAKKPTQAERVADLAEATGFESGFQTTYQPARFEGGWLRDSLRLFYDEEQITDVLASIKGGKEASVYRCAAHPSTGFELLAAKVYRPRQFRSLRNDHTYREGRAVLTSDGRAAKKTDHRLMRAIGKKTAFGVQAAHTSWIMHEFTTLERLHRAGGAVPQPIAANENAILMSYHGDRQIAAPALQSVRLEREQAQALFAEVLRNIELLLRHDLIHGDLSGYNILYWEGVITLIDFPQVTNCHANSHAYAILLRDVTRVCEYFAAQGVRNSPQAITDELWTRYAAVDPADAAADASRNEPSAS